MSNNFIILHGCGHSFQTVCISPRETVCSICKVELADSVKLLSKKAYQGLHHEDEDVDEIDDLSPEDSGNVEEEDNDTDEAIIEETRGTESILRLKQQIFSWGLVPGP